MDHLFGKDLVTIVVKNFFVKPCGPGGCILGGLWERSNCFPYYFLANDMFKFSISFEITLVNSSLLEKVDVYLHKLKQNRLIISTNFLSL